MKVKELKTKIKNKKSKQRLVFLYKNPLRERNVNVL